MSRVVTLGLRGAAKGRTRVDRVLARCHIDLAARADGLAFSGVGDAAQVPDMAWRPDPGAQGARTGSGGPRVFDLVLEHRMVDITDDPSAGDDDQRSVLPPRRLCRHSVSTAVRFHGRGKHPP